MYTKAQLKKYAADLKLDTGKFNSCLDSERYGPAVQTDYNEAIRLNVQGTPTFFINNKSLQVRSFEFSEFAQAFDTLLK